MPSRKLELPTLILQFEVHNRSEGKSPDTVDWYKRGPGSLSPLAARRGHVLLD